MRVLITDCSELSDDLYQRALSIVSEDRRSKALSFVFDKDRRLSLAAGLLVRSLEKEYRMRVAYDENGRPVTDNGMFISISHSGNFSVCAVSEYPIGVDIEKIGNDIDIAKEIMTDREYREFLSSDDKKRFFYELWTGKESIIKREGVGLSKDVRTISVSDNESVKQIQAPEGYAISVCCDDMEVSIETVSCSDLLKLIDN